MKYFNTNKILLYGFVLMLLVLPLVSEADEIEDFFERVGGVVNSATLIVAGIALLAFIWGLVKFISSPGGSGGKDDKGGRADGKKAMGWGIIAMFVMVSLWGIVTLLRISILGEGEAGDIRSMPPPIIDSPFFGGGGTSGPPPPPPPPLPPPPLPPPPPLLLLAHHHVLRVKYALEHDSFL